MRDRKERYQRAATLIKAWAEEDCPCESGGGPWDLEPGFTCGLHMALNEIEDDNAASDKEREYLLKIREAARGMGMNWKAGAPFGFDALNEALDAYDEFKGKK